VIYNQNADLHGNINTIFGDIANSILSLTGILCGRDNKPKEKTYDEVITIRAV